MKDDSDVWGVDDENEEENKTEKSNGLNNKAIKKDNNGNINNNALNSNIVNGSNIKDNNNNLIDEDKKEKVSLIDKSIKHEINSNSNNINEDVVEIESEIKNDLVGKNLKNKEEQKINANDNNKNILNKNKNEISIIPKKHNMTRIKKINIKRGKNDIKDIPDLNEIKSENDKYNYDISMDKIKNKGKNNVNGENNPINSKNNFNQTNSLLNIKNNLDIFNPGLIDNCSEIMKRNFTEKK